MPSVPLLHNRRPDSIFAWQDGKPISTLRFLTDVQSLAEKLPENPYVLNLCADRYRFAVVFSAAMLRGQISLLPPNHTPDLIKRLGQHYPGLYCLTDGADGLAALQTFFYPDLSGVNPTKPAMPEIPATQVAAIVFTSGSTGDPMPNEKTWGAVCRSVTVEAMRLGIYNRGDLTLLGTVPAQHMYGFESTVLIAMQGGVSLHAAKPFFPADISELLQEIPGPRALVTTPVHLRALITSKTALPKLELIVCATAPLSRELAVQAEEVFGAPLQEIYGFTEAGQIASRRTAATEEWQTFDGLALRKEGDVAFVSGGHVVGELPLNDITELHSNTTFLLHGRTADLINIAGKRTSLASLNHHLNSIDGVKDGVFFMPAEKAGETPRLTAFVVASGLTGNEILSALRQRMDAIFLPRPLHMVDALPRNSTGKLTRDSLEKLFQQCSKEQIK
ncbi:MAG TPA: AMP-binding protein [Gallionella sp.]|nr:AMP-binding protein [Gallionella sp.]